jgi:hypothetical protein
VTGESVELGDLEMHAMNRGQRGAEKPDPVHPLQRPHVVFGEARSDLFAVLVQPDVDGHVELGGVCSYAFKRRIRCALRRHAERERGLVAEGIAHRESFC